LQICVLLNFLADRPPLPFIELAPDTFLPQL
jgi:hypothetical protein